MAEDGPITDAGKVQELEQLGLLTNVQHSRRGVKHIYNASLKSGGSALGVSDHPAESSSCTRLRSAEY
jgi:hypothetical protein